ncbi:hypothetical protein DFP73DRAFT_558865 [Morchella snyderi]|nr:hypothetical protein DFP73DRAFT_558865 [Morchella snyderi]
MPCAWSLEKCVRTTGLMHYLLVHVLLPQLAAGSRYSTRGVRIPSSLCIYVSAWCLSPPHHQVALLFYLDSITPATGWCPTPLSS